MQKAQNIYKFHPQGGEGQVPDKDKAAPRKEPIHGFSQESGTVQPSTPGPCAQQGRLCQQEASRQAMGVPGCLSLLAMAVGCQFLLIQVGWEPLLISEFNKLVRIYFFCLCSVSTYVDYYKLM